MCLGLLLAMCLAEPMMAQEAGPSSVEMADGLRASGKIYVVVGVILILLFGLLGYLISLDRKIGRLEKEVRG